MFSTIPLGDFLCRPQNLIEVRESEMNRRLAASARRISRYSHAMDGAKGTRCDPCDMFVLGAMPHYFPAAIKERRVVNDSRPLWVSDPSFTMTAQTWVPHNTVSKSDEDMVVIRPDEQARGPSVKVIQWYF